MATRAQNERKFGHWGELSDGGRRYPEADPFDFAQDIGLKEQGYGELIRKMTFRK